MKQKVFYESPAITVVEIKTERGYAVSALEPEVGGIKFGKENSNAIQMSDGMSSQDWSSSSWGS